MGRTQNLAARILLLGPILVWPLLLAGQTKPPKITRISNAATYEVPLQGRLSATLLISIFGENLAPEVLGAVPPLPVELAGVRVLIGGFPTLPAPLLFVSPTQIDAQVPQGIFNVSAVTVRTAAGSDTKNASDQYYSLVPGIFMRNSGSCGAPVIFNRTPDGIEGLNSPEAPAKPGDWLVILATGAGWAGNVKDGEAAPADRGLRANSPNVLPGLFNREHSPSDYPHDLTWNGKLEGHVGVDEVIIRIPPELPDGCAVPLQLDAGWYSFGPQSQAVPVAISRKRGPCVDPPPDSSAVIRLERVETSGMEPPQNKSLVTMEFIRAQGRMLAHEGDPDYIHRRTVRKMPGGSPSAYDYFERKAGPACPGFEVYRGEPLDPGTIIVEREDDGQQAVLEPKQNENGQWGYTAELPEGMLREGRVRVRGLGGADIGPFEALVEFPPFQVLSDLSPGAKYRWEVKWSGGAAGDGVRVSWGENLKGRPHPRQFLIPSKSGGTHFWPPSAEVTPPPPGLKLPELNLVVEPAELGTVTFQAEGLTLGGRLERRMVYRYQGLVN